MIKKDLVRMSHSQIGLNPGKFHLRMSPVGVAFSLNLFLSRLLPFLLQAWHFTLLKLIGIFISYICCHVKLSGSCVLQHMLNKISIYESHVNDISLFHDYFWDHIFHHLLISLFNSQFSHTFLSYCII